jgi:Rieske Fe-S protein
MDQRRPAAPEGCEPEAAGCAATCSRRVVVRTAAALAAAPALAQLGCARRIDPSRDVTVNAPADGNLVITRASAPELDRVGGSIVLRPTDGSEPVLLANAGDDFLAMAARCPHAGCELTWVQEDKMAECPCHGSRFTSDGTVVYPPADIDVQTYPVTVDRSTLDVTVHLKAGDGVFPPVSNGTVTISTDDHPELQSVGGSVTGRPDGFGRPLIVVRFSQTEVRAFDGTCTHLQCTVFWRPGSQTFQCPCHGSTFSSSGAVTRSPATRNLTEFGATFDGNKTIVVTVG